MEKKWIELCESAKKVLSNKKVSKYVEVGSVAAAVESESGKIYVGISVDAACGLGVCAERNAILNMLTNGESKIKRVIAISTDGKAVAPCGACREFMAQLMENDYKNVEILIDLENDRVVTLGELIPENWICPYLFQFKKHW